jgi:DNA-binding XRE family transcriptional regulator
MDELMAIRRVMLRAGDFFDELREQKGLTLGQIAEELDMNPRSITTLNRGTEKGDWITAFRLSDYLSRKLGRSVPLEDLFSVEKDGQP